MRGGLFEKENAFSCFIEKKERERNVVRNKKKKKDFGIEDLWCV